jgi:Lon protease-like protein
LFPGLVLPLSIFEERYRALVRDLIALPEEAPRVFGVVAIRDGHEVAPKDATSAAAGFGDHPARALFTVGCTADAATIGEHESGGYEIVATGTTRFRVLSIDTTGPYLVGEVEELPEHSGEDAGALTAGVAQAFRTYQRRLAGARERTLTATQQLPDEPSVLSYLVAAATIVDTPAKQRLLEIPDTATRLSDELRLLRRETAVISKLHTIPATNLTQKAPSPN